MTLTLADCLDRKRNHLAAVRILAATAVLFTHAWNVTTPGIKTADYFHVFGFSVDFHGVHAFFILSGLLLTRSLMARPDTLRFVVARVLRYLPAILVSAAIAALLVGPLVTRLSLPDYFASGRPVAFVLAVTSLLDVNAALPGVFDRNPHPGTLYVPLWTVHYEFVFALVLAVLGALGLLRLRGLALAALAMTLAVNVVWFWNGETYASLGWPYHLVRFCSTFGIGVALAIFADRIPVSNRILLALAVAAAPLAYSHVAALAGMMLIAYAILCVGFRGGRVTGALATLGVWSYGFYVSGYLIEQTLAYAAPGLGAWGVWIVAFALSLGAGALSWIFVERPMIARTDALTAALRRFWPIGDRDAEPASVPVRRK